jgi:hypothetical protein
MAEQPPECECFREQSVSGLVTGDLRCLIPLSSGPIAQRLEQGTHNPLVPGSNPGGPKSNFGFRIGDFGKRRAEIEDQIAGELA